jgi:hypothetical protein
MIRPMFVAMALTCTSTFAFAETCIASHYGYRNGFIIQSQQCIEFSMLTSVNPSTRTEHRALASN